jgi:hypothetical protein
LAAISSEIDCDCVVWESATGSSTAGPGPSSSRFRIITRAWMLEALSSAKICCRRGSSGKRLARFAATGTSCSILLSTRFRSRIGTSAA